MITFGYTDINGNYGGHVTGHGFTIVWQPVPEGNFNIGTTIEKVLKACATRLQDLIDTEIATEKDRLAFFHLTSAVDVYDDDEKGVNGF